MSHDRSPTTAALLAEIERLRARVTELESSERRLQSERRALVRAAESAPIVLFGLGADGRVEFLTGAGLAAIGRTLENTVGRSVFELYPGNPAVEDGCRRALAGETLRVNAEIADRTLEVHMHPVRDDGGRVANVIGVAMDITERLRDEQAVGLSQRQLLSVFDSIDEPIYVSDPETYEILFVNEAFRRYWGDREGYKCYQVMQERSEPCEFCTNDRIFGENAGQPYVWEFWNPSNRRWYRCLDRAIPWPDGRLVRCQMALDITDWKETEQALAENQRVLSMLMANLPGLVYRCLDDRDWTMSFVSDGCRELTGYTPEDIIRGRISYHHHIIHPDDRETVADRARRALRENRPFQITYRVTTADGREKWVWEQGRAVFGPNGEVEGIEGFITDVTKRKLAEERAHLLARAVEQISEGIALGDRNSKLLFVNRSFAAMHGYSPEELIGRDLSIFHPGGQMRTVKRGQRKAMKDGHFEGEVWHTHRDGTVFPTLMHLHRFRDEQGRDIGMIGTVRDTTEQRRAEELIRESEKNYRTGIDSMADAVHVVDADLHILLANVALQKWHEELHLTGEIIGRGLFEVFPFLPPGTREKYDEVLSTGHAVVTEETIHIGDREFTTETRRIPVIEGGRVARVVTVVRDLTEHRRMEEHRARLEEQLYQVQKLEAIGQLAGGVAHDFNNLLAVIMGNASILQKDHSLPAKVRDALADIMKAAERGSAFCQQLLAYARGGLQQPVATEINRLIRAVVPMLERSAPPRLKCRLDLAENLPTIIADPPRIEQMLLNLCMNAIQASAPPATVTVTTAEETLDDAAAAKLGLEAGPYVRLTVADHGAGMDAETLKKAFEPFFTTREMGRGMGLAVTHGIVKSHRGQITLDSRVGEGTTAIVRLPAADQPEAAVQPSAPKPKAARPPRGTETILIIDDEAAVAGTVEQMLGSLGYCVVSHTGTDEAIGFLGSNAEDIDLVLCDLNMPGRSGREMARYIREHHPHITVMITSGFEDEEAERALEEGAAGFVQKPFSLMALALAVRETLDRTASQRHPRE